MYFDQYPSYGHLNQNSDTYRFHENLFGMNYEYVVVYEESIQVVRWERGFDTLFFVCLFLLFLFGFSQYR